MSCKLVLIALYIHFVTFVIFQFQASLDQLRFQKSIKVMILRSAVPGIFCAGQSFIRTRITTNNIDEYKI